MVSKDRTLLYFEGTNPILGCTILLSGNREVEGKELQEVKLALREILKLARNVVLERSFLDQINCQVPRPLLDDKSSTSPYLITKNIKNRSMLVLNKVIMKKGVISQQQAPAAGATGPPALPGSMNLQVSK
jgi:hypothetical protein